MSKELVRTSKDHLKVRNEENKVQDCTSFFPQKAHSPMTTDYCPEIDVSTELNAIDAAYYQSLIGVVRWMVELGRLDICIELLMLSSCLALPREEHLHKLFHMISYLEKQHNCEMVFDHTVPDIYMSDFPNKDWNNLVYSNERDELKEEIPTYLPTPLGKGFCLRVYVESDHPGDQVRRRSKPGSLSSSTML